MDSWVLVADQPRDLVARDLPHVIVSSEDYVARPYMFGGARQKIIILARSYNYQTAGYYCALLAEARGHRVMPSVETMLDLRGRAEYAHALPELEEALNSDLKSFAGEPPKTLFVAFGLPETAGFERFSQRLFDWFRAPMLTVTFKGEELAHDPEDRADPACPLHGGSEALLHRGAEILHRPQVAGAEAALGAAPFDRRPLRPEGGAAAELAEDADALGEDRRAARRRGRADHQEGPVAARGVRRALHPRDHLDPQSHLPFRPPRHDGRDAGHRRSDLDDPLHQQGLSLGAADACRACRFPRRSSSRSPPT